MMFKKSRVVIGGLCVATLIGCGGTGQDDGTVSTFDQNYSGVVIDGYVARATVFLDTNNDSRRNGWEAYAFTDDDGYFSYNPLTDTDYCASDATAEQQQFCLRTNVSYDNIVIRIDGGYDVLTGEPFEGQMSRRISAVGDGTVADTMISPLTSLLTEISDPVEQDAVLATLGLDEDDLSVNYLDVSGGEEVDAEILNAALKVHKVVTVMSDRILDTYDEIGEESGTPPDVTRLVYRELAEQLTDTDSSFDTLVADVNTVATVLDTVETEVQSIYTDNELSLPSDMGSVESAGDFARVAQVSGALVSVVNSVIDDSVTDLTRTEALGQARVIEGVVIKILDESGTDSSIDNAEDFFTESSNSDLVDALVQSMSSEASDINALSENDFTGTDFDSEEEIDAAVQLGNDVMPFSQVAGMQLRVSDLDLGSGPNDLDDAEVEWYFSGETGDLSGSFTACVKYIEGANSDGTLEEGSTRGEIVNGFWSLLGATGENVESYSLLITLTFLGTEYQAILKPAGTEDIESISYERIRFDNAGDISVWHSAAGFEQLGTVPTTDTECRERLPSRIGI